MTTYEMTVKVRVSAPDEYTAQGLVENLMYGLEDYTPASRKHCELHRA